jgi:hypothetical protein
VHTPNLCNLCIYLLRQKNNDEASTPPTSMDKDLEMLTEDEDETSNTSAKKEVLQDSEPVSLFSNTVDECFK